MSPRYELVVFDWDGTLVDSRARIVGCFHATIAELSLPTHEDHVLSSVVGLALPETADVLFPGRGPEFAAGFVEAYRRHWWAPEAAAVDLFPGVRAALATLGARGLTLAVATGKGRRGLDRELHELGVADVFAFTRCADETRGKPHPDLLHDILARAGTSPERTLVVGDTDYDLHMARNAGVAALAVTWGMHDRQRLAAAEPLGYLETIDDLHRWLA